MLLCTKCNSPVSTGPNAIVKERHGEIVMKHRICPHRLTRKKSRTYQGPAPRKLGWRKARLAAIKETCEVSGDSLLFTDEDGVTHFKVLHIDHIVPERMVIDHPKGPHARINLICLSPSEHSKKRRAEDQLLKSGDLLTYLQMLSVLGWPMERVHSALRFYGLRYYGLEREVQTDPEKSAG